MSTTLPLKGEKSTTARLVALGEAPSEIATAVIGEIYLFLNGIDPLTLNPVPGLIEVRINIKRTYMQL